MHALNIAQREAKTEFIIITNPNSLYDANTIKMILYELTPLIRPLIDIIENYTKPYSAEYIRDFLYDQEKHDMIENIEIEFTGTFKTKKEEHPIDVIINGKTYTIDSAEGLTLHIRTTFSCKSSFRYSKYVSINYAADEADESISRVEVNGPISYTEETCNAELWFRHTRTLKRDVQFDNMTIIGMPTAILLEDIKDTQSTAMRMVIALPQVAFGAHQTAHCVDPQIYVIEKLESSDSDDE